MRLDFYSEQENRIQPPSDRRSPWLLLLSVVALWIGCVVLSAPLAHAQATPSPLRPTDLLKIQEIQDLTLSPTGRNVAYTVRRVVAEPDGKTDRTRLYVVPADGRAGPRLLTRTPHDVSQPAWHPDGGRLAFVRPVDGTPQVFVLSLSGGEAYQLTDAPHGATHPKWSPSGDRLLFASPIPEADLHRRTGRRPPVQRPGRTPQDTIRRVPPDTILVLRNARTLDPTDTLALGSNGPRLPSDTARSLRTPGGPSVPDSLRTLSMDSLRTLSPDSLLTVFERLQVLPDTTLVPVRPDTAASPDGDLLQVRRWLDQNRRRTGAQVFARPDPHDERGLDPTTTYRHYFLVEIPDDIRSRTPPRPSAQPVTRGYRSYHDATWMPDGTQIVVSAAPASPDSAPRSRDRNLYVVDLQPYGVQQLLDVDGYALSAPRVTSDGTTLAFQAQDLSAPSYTHAKIGLFEVDGRSNPQFISTAFDHDVSTLRWSPDGWYLYATAPTATGRPLYRFAPFARGDTTTDRRSTSLADSYVSPRDTFSRDAVQRRTARHRQLLDETRTVQAYDVTDSKAVYAATGPQNPSELYGNTISFSTEQRLSSHNVGWTTGRTLGSTERLTVQNENLTVSARLTKPINFVDTLRYPLVVVPRGGPPALSSVSPIPSWFERHVLAGRGYGVLEVWSRGSDGYGHAFRHRNFQDWGPGPASDVLAVTDSVTARTWVDSTQLGIAGHSYGGYLAAWLLGQTDRFQAAVAQSGIYDLPALFGAGTAGSLVSEQFGGFPWETDAVPPSDLLRRPAPSPLLSVGLLPRIDTTTSPRAALRRNSPMTRAHRIETPLLLVHGGADRHVGAGQAKRLHRRLQILDRPVEYVRYPRAGHDLWESVSPLQRMDRVVRLYEFLARYMEPGGHSPSTP